MQGLGELTWKHYFGTRWLWYEKPPATEKEGLPALLLLVFCGSTPCFLLLFRHRSDPLDVFRPLQASKVLVLKFEGRSSPSRRPVGVRYLIGRSVRDISTRSIFCRLSTPTPPGAICVEPKPTFF